MSTPTLSITGTGLWLDGVPTAAAWRAGERDAAATRPLGRALDRVNRRRGSLLSRALADVAAEAMGQAGVDAARVPLVVGSSIGEASSLIELLDQIWRQREPMSPTGFTMSVHNAAAGLISISNGNRGFTTSLAADHDTPAAALLEALGLVQMLGEPVLVACADETPPELLVSADVGYQLLAAAVILAPGDAPGLAHLGLVPDARPTLSPTDLPERLARNPQVGLLDLVVAVLAGQSGRVRLNREIEAGWCAEIAGG